jgi:hypothetical protein
MVRRLECVTCAERWRAFVAQTKDEPGPTEFVVLTRGLAGSPAADHGITVGESFFPTGAAYVCDGCNSEIEPSSPAVAVTLGALPKRVLEVTDSLKAAIVVAAGNWWVSGYLTTVESNEVLIEPARLSADA